MCEASNRSDIALKEIQPAFITDFEFFLRYGKFGLGKPECAGAFVETQCIASLLLILIVNKKGKEAFRALACGLSMPVTVIGTGMKPLLVPLVQEMPCSAPLTAQTAADRKRVVCTAADGIAVLRFPYHFFIFRYAEDELCVHTPSCFLLR